MNRRILLGISFALSATVAFGAPRKIAYEQDGNIFVADLDGTHAKKITIGAWPKISSDGKWIAFNTEDHSKTRRPSLERHIAVAEIVSGKVTTVKGIPSDNCFGPTWSPDGSQLIFSIMADNRWQLGLINVDGTSFRFLTHSDSTNTETFEPAWAPDRKSFFCHDLNLIYQIDLDGKLLKQWEVAKILTDATMNSGNRLCVSPDGKTLLMDVDLNAEHERKNWDGPQPAIYKLDIDSEKAIRITGKDDFVWDGFWLSDNEFLCVIQKENEKEPSIYRMPIDGKNPKLVVKHARTPTASLGTP
jgi:TolB protein